MNPRATFPLTPEQAQRTREIERYRAYAYGLTGVSLIVLHEKAQTLNEWLEDGVRFYGTHDGGHEAAIDRLRLAWVEAEISRRVMKRTWRYHVFAAGSMQTSPYTGKTIGLPYEGPAECFVN